MEQQTKAVNLTINGKAIQAPAGKTVIQAALDNGIFIPHYCYHQDLSIAGVCRMCVCDIEKNPKLQISCNTIVAEGMVVTTENQKVKDAVKSALELHLINHPIDCPICDKAGECKLQDYYADYGLYASRMELQAKVHKPKVQDIGTIVLDSERCILCTRCVRFTAEVTKTYELGIFNRGDRSVLNTYDSGPLRNDYTGNLADICPVGALTAKDFRFQCRVWFLEKTSSVCTMCARGCNTTVSVNPKIARLYRVEPRRNPDVNSSWICDRGRWDYHYVYDNDRVKTPLKNVGGVSVEATWHEAFGALHKEIAAAPTAVAVGLSTHLTNEELTDAVQTLSALGVTQFVRVVDDAVVSAKKPVDGILLHADSTPNAQGFGLVMKSLKAKWMTVAEGSALLAKGGVTRLLLLGLENRDLPGVEPLVKGAKGAKIAAHATSRVPLLEVCDWILPNVSAFEKSGTLVNALGRAQKLNAAIAWQELARDAHALVFGLAKGSDREAMPALRTQQLYEATTGKMLFQNDPPKWRAFRPEGVTLEGAVV